MTATNMCYNFVGFRYSPLLRTEHSALVMGPLNVDIPHNYQLKSCQE